MFSWVHCSGPVLISQRPVHFLYVDRVIPVIQINFNSGKSEQGGNKEAKNVTAKLRLLKLIMTMIYLRPSMKK